MCSIGPQEKIFTSIVGVNGSQSLTIFLMNAATESEMERWVEGC